MRKDTEIEMIDAQAKWLGILKTNVERRQNGWKIRRMVVTWI